jgi:multidrug efflux pump subunit AcrA (membrane-fusion protein)
MAIKRSCANLSNFTRLAFAFTLLLLVACGSRAGVRDRQGDDETAPETSSGATETPRPTLQEPAGTTIVADGQLEPVHPNAVLSFVEAGRVHELFVEAGQQVSAGDPIATLDDEALAAAVTSAELAVSQAETTLAQAKLSLEDLLTWEPDSMAVALAEANVAAAEANLERAQTQDAAAGNSLVSARVGIEGAELALADAQEAYDTAWDPGRDWELNDPFRKVLLEREREAAERAVGQAENNLAVARANYNLALAGLNSDSALNAEANLASARQALAQAQSGPRDSEIAAAQLQVRQAELSLEGAEFNLAKARNALENVTLVANQGGTVLSVSVSEGALVGSGTPIVTIVDTEQLRFHTTNLSERDLGYVRPGQPVAVTLKAYPGQPLEGTVAYIDPQASGAVGDAATFTVVVELEETDLALRPGMTGRAELRAGEE